MSSEVGNRSSSASHGSSSVLFEARPSLRAIDSSLAELRRRLLLQLALRWYGICALVLVDFALVAAWLYPGLFYSADRLVVTAILLISPALIALIRCLAVRVPRERLARALDERARLDERIATAWEAASFDSPAPPLTDLLAADAVANLRSADIAVAIPIRRDAILAAIGLFVTVALCMWRAPQVISAFMVSHGASSRGPVFEWQRGRPLNPGGETPKNGNAPKPPRSPGTSPKPASGTSAQNRSQQANGAHSQPSQNSASQSTTSGSRSDSKTGNSTGTGESGSNGAGQSGDTGSGSQGQNTPGGSGAQSSDNGSGSNSQNGGSGAGQSRQPGNSGTPRSGSGKASGGAGQTGSQTGSHGRGSGKSGQPGGSGGQGGHPAGHSGSGGQGSSSAQQGSSGGPNPSGHPRPGIGGGGPPGSGSSDSPGGSPGSPFSQGEHGRAPTVVPTDLPPVANRSRFSYRLPKPVGAQTTTVPDQPKSEKTPPAGTASGSQVAYGSGGVTIGSSGAASVRRVEQDPRIPAGYRQLVKQYFGAGKGDSR